MSCSCTPTLEFSSKGLLPKMLVDSPVILKAMSKSALDLHLKSAIAIQKGSSLSLHGATNSEVKPRRKSGTKEVKVVKSSKNGGKERNLLDEARKVMQGKKTQVDSIVKSLGENGSSKKFSKRRLKSLIKVQRTY